MSVFWHNRSFPCHNLLTSSCRKHQRLLHCRHRISGCPCNPHPLWLPPLSPPRGHCQSLASNQPHHLPSHPLPGPLLPASRLPHHPPRLHSQPLRGGVGQCALVPPVPRCCGRRLALRVEFSCCPDGCPGGRGAAAGGVCGGVRGGGRGVRGIASDRKGRVHELRYVVRIPH